MPKTIHKSPLSRIWRMWDDCVPWSMECCCYITAAAGSSSKTCRYLLPSTFDFRVKRWLRRGGASHSGGLSSSFIFWGKTLKPLNGWFCDENDCVEVWWISGVSLSEAYLLLMGPKSSTRARSAGWLWVIEFWTAFWICLAKWKCRCTPCVCS